MGNNRLELFRVVRRGYAPEEVLECFGDFIETFRRREEQHALTESELRRELMKLKLENDEGRTCLQGLQRRLDSVEKENMELRLRVVLDAPPEEESSAGSSGAEREDAWQFPWSAPQKL